MARTRAQDKAGTKGEDTISNTTKRSKKREQPGSDVSKEPKGDNAAEEGEPVGEPPAKKSKQEGDEDTAKVASNKIKTDNPKIRQLLDSYGALPLQDSNLSEPTQPTAETMLAHLLNAMLTSTRISHQLAAKTIRTVIQAGYADLQKLEKSSWEERTEVLTEGGYTRYREKTATQLGDLAVWLRDKYDGDLNNLLKAAKNDAGKDAGKVHGGVRERIREVKGVGGVALDIFCDTAQGVWHELAPFLDPRSDKTVGSLGLPTDVGELYEAVRREPVQMCKLASALTTVRLEKKEKEFD